MTYMSYNLFPKKKREQNDFFFFFIIISLCALITLRFSVAVDVVYVVYDIRAGAQCVLLLVLGGGLCCVVMHQPALI